MLKTYYFNKPKEQPGMVLQERDLKLLELIEQFRFLDSRTLYKLIQLYYLGSYEDNIKRRLHKLWANGYLLRPTEQVVLFFRSAQRHLVYCLSEVGAELLCSRLGMDQERLRWRLKQDEISYKFIEHALELSRFRATFYLCQKEKGFEIPFWLGDGEFQRRVTFWVEGEVERELCRRYFVGREKAALTVRPDGFFGLRRGDQIRFYAVEWDRGSRTTKELALKFLAFAKLWQGMKEEPMVLEGHPVNRFRVLVLAPSEARIRHLREWAMAIAESEGGLQRFLFNRADRVNLDDPALVLEDWQSAEGKRFSLFE